MMLSWPRANLVDSKHGRLGARHESGPAGPFRSQELELEGWNRATVTGDWQPDSWAGPRRAGPGSGSARRRTRNCHESRQHGPAPPPGGQPEAAQAYYSVVVPPAASQCRSE